MVALHYNMNDDNNRDSSSQVLSDLYPDPKTLPAPSTLREPIPSVTLSELEPGKYISTTARIAYIRTAEKTGCSRRKSCFYRRAGRFYKLKYHLLVIRSALPANKRFSL